VSPVTRALHICVCVCKTAAVLDAGNSHILQLTMRNSFHAVGTEAVAELGRGHPHQNLAQCSVAMLPVLSLHQRQNSYVHMLKSFLGWN